ncbi:toxin-antitoxin system TumE family protein [Natrinema soli]|uniref:DUF6516 family protein n=1 Tax=Natrinema soli TaxID=1930624 RepID=A0ABD5SEK8_9EURY|nr:DUF6516 family protein [Natrinema soli]
MAETLLDDEFTYDDGSRVVVTAHLVPESEEYPTGIKYRFQYMDAEGNTLLRFDNAPHHDVGNHHEHRDEDIEAVAFESLTEHYQRFKHEVDTIYDQRNA